MQPGVRAFLLAATTAMAPLSAWAQVEQVQLRQTLAPTAQDAAPSAIPQPRPEISIARTARPRRFGQIDSSNSNVRALLAQQAQNHGVPAALVDAVARLESRYNPRAANRGNYGLMQIRLQTARGEGYSGSAEGLLDAETNAHFGVKHLARAYRLANGDACGTLMLYQNGLAARRMTDANRVYCAKAKALMDGRMASAS